MAAFPDPVGGFFHVDILAPLLGGIAAAVFFVRVLEPLMKHGPGDCCGGPKKPVHFNNLETPVIPRKVLPGLGDNTELSRQATDPTASLMALNFQSTWIGGYHGATPPGEADNTFQFAFRPVIPFEVLGKPNILRLTMPYQTGGRGEEGFKPISIFDLLVFNESWGRWGIGPVMTFDTTGDMPDDFVIGPAVGGVWQVSKKFNVGLFTQNVYWSNTAVTQIQPVIAYQLGSGWSLSAGDLQFTYDWETSRWINLPLGFQIGKVMKIGGLPSRFAINPQYNLQNDRGLSEWQVTFTFTALFPSF